MEINSKLHDLKEQWGTFKRNKEWILSLLFVCSIVHSILLYGFFGINIFEFYSLTDIFINFAEVFVPFILLLSLGGLLSLWPNGKKCAMWLNFAIKFLIFMVAGIFISLIFDNAFSIIFILYIIIVFWIFNVVNKRVFAWFFTIFMLLVSLGLPIEKRMMYKSNTPLVDRLSITYLDKEYDLSDIDHYYFIGGSVDFFFIYDKCKSKVVILPKSDCKNINRKAFTWNDLWKSETFFNSQQRERMHRRKLK